MTQQELDHFRTEISIAKELGDEKKLRAAELAFERRLHECQIHTGQRVERLEKEIADSNRKLGALGTKLDEIADYQRMCAEKKKVAKAEVVGMAKLVQWVARLGWLAGGGAGGVAALKLLEATT